MSQIGPLLSPLLVGRDDLLNLADRRLAEAAEGNGQLLLLAGQAGVGKSRLLQVILRKARTAGFKVARPTSPRRTCWCRWARSSTSCRTMRMIAGFRELGDDVFTRRDGGASDSLATRRLLVHDIAERIIDAIDGPALLAFEDIQWADELSLEVIGDLARLIRDRPILLVAAYRIDELPIGSIHREWRARLLSQRFAEEARLEPLTYEQTALVTTLILDTGLPAPRDVVDAVYQRTDGIPLHIEELLGALGEDARSDDRAIRNAKVPETIEDAILARVAHLSPEARAVASAGAVIGRCFMPERPRRRHGQAGRRPRRAARRADRERVPVQLRDGGRGLLRLPAPAAPRRAVPQRAGGRPPPAARAGRRVRRRAHRRGRDPCVGALRTGGPPGRGVSHGPGGSPRGQRGLEPPRVLRALSGAPSPTPPRTWHLPSSRPCMRRCPRPRRAMDQSEAGMADVRGGPQATSLRPATRPWRPSS